MTSIDPPPHGGYPDHHPPTPARELTGPQISTVAHYERQFGACRRIHDRVEQQRLAPRLGVPRMGLYTYFAVGQAPRGGCEEHFEAVFYVVLDEVGEVRGRTAHTNT